MGNKTILLVYVLVAAPSLLVFSIYSATTSNADSRTLIQAVPFSSSPAHVSTLTASAAAAVEPTVTLPNCMQLRKEDPYLKTGQNLLGKNLCEAFTGKNRTDCVYRHPEIFHYVFYTRNAKDNVFGFREYLSLFSVDKFYKPEKIVIHCNNQPITGKYWEMLQNLSTPIEMQHMDRIPTIGKRKEKPGFIEHEADYMKIMSGLKDGGIYSDFDVIILNGSRLREMQRQSEVVIGRSDDWCKEICIGFFSSVPSSPFMEKWLDSYENDYKMEWTYNSGYVPSRLLANCSECYHDITVDSHTSNWNTVNDWMKEGKLEWRQKAVAHYMNSGFMKPLKPPNEILNMSTPFSQMVKYVLGDTVKYFMGAAPS